MPVIRITLCLPGVEGQKWKGKRTFSPEHTIDFILTLFKYETQREVRWEARVSPKEAERTAEVDMEGDHEVLFPPKRRDDVVIPPTTQRVLEVPDCAVGSVTNMVRTLNDAISAVSQDTAQIQQAYQQLRRDNLARDKALADLTAMVKEYGESPAATRPYGPPTPKINTDVLDRDGNLRAADIGITWADNETFLHGVRIVWSKIPRPAGHEPVMSTPYPERGNDGQVTPSMTGQPSSPETI